MSNHNWGWALRFPGAIVLIMMSVCPCDGQVNRADQIRRNQLRRFIADRQNELNKIHAAISSTQDKLAALNTRLNNSEIELTAANEKAAAAKAPADQVKQQLDPLKATEAQYQAKADRTAQAVAAFEGQYNDRIEQSPPMRSAQEVLDQAKLTCELAKEQVEMDLLNDRDYANDRKQLKALQQQIKDLRMAAQPDQVTLNKLAAEVMGLDSKVNQRRLNALQINQTYQSCLKVAEMAKSSVDSIRAELRERIGKNVEWVTLKKYADDMRAELTHYQTQTVEPVEKQWKELVTVYIMANGEVQKTQKMIELTKNNIELMNSQLHKLERQQEITLEQIRNAQRELGRLGR